MKLIIENFRKFLAEQNFISDIPLETDEQGNVIQRPIYPYADPSEPVDVQGALPGSEGADFERFAPFLPGYEAPVNRYDQELKFRDTVLPSQDQFLKTGSESYFDLGPTEQGEIPPPPEPVDPISAIDFMALSEPEF